MKKIANPEWFRKVVCNIVLGGVIISVLAVTTIGNVAIGVSGVVKPIYRGESDSRASLMFNVYWGSEYIIPILDVLDKNSVKTTFFVGGCWAAENESLLKEIHSRGHEIGNHGYYHKDHDKISATRNREEIEITHKLVKSILGIDMDLFAPPSGAFSDVTLKVAEELGYRTVMWSADTIDWRDKDADLICRRALKDLGGGSLILMHPTAATLEALPKIIAEIKGKGLTVSTVSGTLKREPM